jgi:membrane protein required for colicin V production
MDLLQQATSFDIGVLAAFALLIARGIWVGFIKQLASILAMIIAFIAAGRLHENFYQTILPVVNHSNIAFIISYLGLFIATYLGVILLGMGLKKVVEIIMLAWFDRLLGGVVGAAKAVFLASLVFMILANILSGSNNFLRRSLCYPYLKASSAYILQLIKDADLRSSFKPKEPAIKEDALPAEEPRVPDKRNEQPPADAPPARTSAGLSL